MNTHSIEQSIQDKLYRFELLALLRLLRHLGYENVWYRSSEQLVSEHQVIERIEFLKGVTSTPLSRRESTAVNEESGKGVAELFNSQAAKNYAANTQVILHLNIGLLGPQSPLPSYFLKMRDTLMVDDDAFVKYIGFFDHILISEMLKQLFPEFSDYYGVPWAQWQKDSFLQNHVVAIRNVHLIFAAIFPEYVIHCQWQQQAKWNENGTRLGEFVVGETQGLGGAAGYSLSYLSVLLSEREEGNGENQAVALPILQQRLASRVLPLFQGIDLNLGVYLRGRQPPLHFSASLGYHPLSKPLVQGKQCLFSGNTYRVIP